MHDGAASTCGDGHGEFPHVGSGDGGNGLDEPDFAHEFDVFVFFFFGDFFDVKIGEILFFAEEKEDVSGGNAPHLVEAFAGEGDAVTVGDDVPCCPVKEHGIGQGAIEIENQSVYLFVTHGCEWKPD